MEDVNQRKQLLLSGYTDCCWPSMPLFPPCRQSVGSKLLSLMSNIALVTAVTMDPVCSNELLNSDQPSVMQQNMCVSRIGVCVFVTLVTVHYKSADFVCSPWQKSEKDGYTEMIWVIIFLTKLFFCHMGKVNLYDEIFSLLILDINFKHLFSSRQPWLTY